MKIEIKGITLEVNVVYSVYHTGTWFTVNLLGTSKEGYEAILGRSDSWIREHNNCRIEEFLTDSLDNKWIQKMLKKVPKEFFNFKMLTLQAHHIHSKRSIMLNILKNKKSKVPIIIPMRDPLISINSKI